MLDADSPSLLDLVWQKSAAAEILEAIAQGADPKAADHMGDTPLMAAARVGSSELVDLLIPMSDVGARDFNGRQALHHAASGGALACVEALLARPESDPCARDALGLAPLAIAAFRNEEDSDLPDDPGCVLALLPRSDPRWVDNDGYTALMLAALR